MSTLRYLIGAIIITVIFAIILKYTRVTDMDDQKIAIASILLGLIYYCIMVIHRDRWRRGYRERMTNVGLDINVTPFPMYENTYEQITPGYNAPYFPDYQKYPEMKRPVYPILKPTSEEQPSHFLKITPPPFTGEPPTIPIPHPEIKSEQMHPELRPNTHPQAATMVRSEMLHKPTCVPCSNNTEPFHNESIHNESIHNKSIHSEASPCRSCDKPAYMPRPYSLSRCQEDASNTGIMYNNDNPPYPLLHQHQFEQTLSPSFMKMEDIIDEQRYNYPNYHYQSPGYFRIDKNIFSGKTIPYSEAPTAICESKMRDFYNQHNHNIVSSPHTHYGKSRGYMNWEIPNPV